LLFEITIIISWHTPNKLLVENPLANTLHIHSFSAHYTVLNNMKSIFTIKPAITENIEYMIIKARMVKAHTPVIDIKVCVLP